MRCRIMFVLLVAIAEDVVEEVLDPDAIPDEEGEEIQKAKDEKKRAEETALVRTEAVLC